MSYEVPLERGKFREFALATKAESVAHFTDDPVMPATFLTVARLMWEPKDQNPMAGAGLDRRRVLHGEEEYAFHGPPPRAGQTLTVESRLDEQWEKTGKRGGVMRFVRVLTEFRDETGALVAEQRSTAIETARAPKEA
ncbi:MAG: MaoC family dehydratase N-terminal domain-containing protein [Actinobacteria bacterium]|nr:MaoC family dehydratase N-terminal domain-containing protein [Actinomycetota bacterium]